MSEWEWDLNAAELKQAMDHAMALRDDSLKSGRRDKWGAAQGDAMSWRELNGAAGHRAVCKVYGLPYHPGVGQAHWEPDIPPDIQVRTRDPYGWDEPELCWRPGDPVEHRYVLVWARWYHGTIRGWCPGEVCADPQFRHPSGRHYIPHKLLRPPDTFVVPP